MASPIKGTKGSDNGAPLPIVTGTAGNDKLQGKAGNDKLKGLAGDDDIDGGQGIDTAIYTGSFLDYDLSFKGTGNNKISLHDTVAGRDGTDQLKNVEWLQFSDALVDVANNDVYFADATLHSSAQDPASPGNMFAGSGIPADHFGIVQDLNAGIELGLKVHKRFDTPSTVTTTDDYADGELHFQVDDGPGNPPANNRAEWNFDFSIATGLNGQTTDLSDFTFKLLYDVDKGTGTDFRVFTLEAETTPQAAGQSGFQWRDEDTGLVFIADDEGNANVTQNSENYGFSFIRGFIDDDPGTAGIQPYNFGPGEFDIILQAYDNSNALIAQNHIVVDVI